MLNSLIAGITLHLANKPDGGYVDSVRYFSLSLKIEYY